MKSKELLFELIHSLTKSEKRYFKVSNSNNKVDANYLKLFDAIQAQTKYDEDALLIEFKEQEFVKQFSVAKNYLMNLILKSLTQHHQKAKKSMELNQLLSEIEILYWKGLYKLADKKIYQAKKVAKQYDFTAYLLLLNYWYSRIESYISKTVINEKASKELEEYIQDFNVQMKMNLLLKRLEVISKSTLKSTDESAKLIEEIFSDELMQLDEEQLRNYHTKTDYLFLKGVGNAVLGNGKEEIYYKKKLITYLEENPHQIKENPIKYGSAINNILMYYTDNGYSGDYPYYLEKLDQFDSKFSHVKNIFDDTKHNLKLGYYLHMNDVEKLKPAIKEMEAWYKTTSIVKNVQAKMICEFNMALIFYVIDDTKSSLKWSSSCFAMFDLKTKKFRHDIAISALLLQALIYFDLEHFDLAKKNLELMKSIAEKNKYGSTEMKLLEVLDKLFKNDQNRDAIKKLNVLIDQGSNHLINLDLDCLQNWLMKH